VIDQILADERVSSLSSASDVLWPLVDNLGTVRDLVNLKELFSGQRHGQLVNSKLVSVLTRKHLFFMANAKLAICYRLSNSSIFLFFQKFD